MTIRLEGNPEPFTFNIPRDLRDNLEQLAHVHGVSAGECLRRILADHFAQLREAQQ